MENTSCRQLAEELLAGCLEGRAWRRAALERLVGAECSAEFFRVVVEGLADRFDPLLCQTYASVFAEALAIASPGLDAWEIAARYERIRKPRPYRAGAEPPETVFVLSRVTLGADVAITSVILDAVKRRFPDARIELVGSRKNWELFAADPRIGLVEAAYPRAGSLAERLAAAPALSRTKSIVIDPDSRLTQLGLLQVSAEDDYYYFDSRAYGADSEASLGELTRDWVRRTFGIRDPQAYIAPLPGAVPAGRPLVTVSLGVGENPAKRVDDPFETALLRALTELGGTVYVDEGAGGEESERVRRAVESCGGRVHTARGAFAPFAWAISQSDLYVGYDSAGQHVAAACGVPVVTVFAGFPAPRMLSRWRPSGPGRIEVVRVDPGEGAAPVLERTLQAIARCRILDRGVPT
ncbi:MAG: glycosyltransferase family 9 protein [Bryobacteraceae bacterium]